MRLRFAFIWLFLFAAVTRSFSVPLENLVSPAYAARLRSNGEEIIETQMRNPYPVLTPLNSDLRYFVSSAINALNPNMMVEALFLYRKQPNSICPPKAGMRSREPGYLTR